MKSLSKKIVAAALMAMVAATGLAPAPSIAQTAAGRSARAPVKPPFPALRLAEMSRGERAIANLGSRLPEVAAYYGKTARDFAAQLRTDRSAWIDRTGRLLYVEEGLTASPSDLVPSGPVFALEQTFALHSRPSSRRKIYLDFNGHTATGGAWNSSYGVDPIISPAFDLDGNPGTFSTAELAMIQNIWRRVAEDYAAFDVDVTTEEPSAAQMTRSALSDDTFGTRALITKNFTAGTVKGDCGCGGFAYVGVFDSTSEANKPAYVFQDKLGNSEKSIAEAVSHEVGHNLGLSHDGTSTLGYYRGHGTGVTGWAPIMGVGYSKELVQFSKGEYLDANNREDDFLVMQSNGVVFAADDFGNTMASAASLYPTPVGGMNDYTIQGLVETPSDIDYFKFAAAAGIVTIKATPFERSPNLDILIQLLDANGALVAVSNPADLLSGAISVTIPAAGTYYLSIQGTGAGDAKGTGYAVYGSIGRYSMTVSAPAAGSFPVAAISASATSGPAPLTVQFSAAGSSDAGGAIQSYEWNFGDGSALVTTAAASHTYSVPGTYSATLKVTNSAGLSDSRAVAINATSVQPKVFVDSIAMTLVTGRNGQVYAQAKVSVKDVNGNLISGATVTGDWSGLVAGSASVLTGAAGVATFDSPQTKKAGTFKYAVRAIAAPGLSYDATLNAMTSNAITK